MSVDAQPKLTSCFMVKNEALFIREALLSVASISDEILVMDTGSDDETLEVIAELALPQLRVLHGEWKDDYSWSRNQLIAAAKNDWVFFLDGDEILEPKQIAALKEALQNPRLQAASFIQRNYTQDANTADAVAAEGKIPALKSSKDLYYFENWMERLLRKSSGLQYEGRIHESLFPAANRKNLVIEKIPIVLHHYGRLKPQYKKKLEYYLKLTERKLNEDYENPVAWVEWLLTLDESGEQEEALMTAKEAAKKFPQTDLVLETCYRVALRAGAYDEALVWIDRILKKNPRHSKARPEKTIALLYLGKWDECQQLAKELLNEDAKNFLAHLHLGIIHFEKREWTSAKQHLEIAAKQKPQDEFLRSALAKIPKLQ